MGLPEGVPLELTKLLCRVFFVSKADSGKDDKFKTSKVSTGSTHLVRGESLPLQKEKARI